MAPILVAYASKHGSTREVAETVAAELEGRGCEVDLRPAREVRDVRPYAGVVLGSALYVGRPHRDARRFLARHRAELRRRRFAVFAMGPRTQAAEDVADSRAQIDRALPFEPDLVVIFGGVIDQAKLHFPFNRMEACDARDWDEIRDWAAEVADLVSLRRAPVRSPAGRTA